jgi:hypothetical protein
MVFQSECPDCGGDLVITSATVFWPIGHAPKVYSDGFTLNHSSSGRTGEERVSCTQQQCSYEGELEMVEDDTLRSPKGGTNA